MLSIITRILARANMLTLENHYQKIQYLKKKLSKNNHINKALCVLQASIKRAEEEQANELASLLRMKQNGTLKHENLEKNFVNTAIIKPVGSRCNLNCDYCYYSGKTFSPEKLQKKYLSVMNESLLRRIISEMLITSPNQVCFIWHGGEPFLAGINFYKKVVKLQQEMRKNGQQIRNIIQTNATLINGTNISFFKKNQFEIGISLDGQRNIHNIHRKYLSGKESFSNVMNSLTVLKQRGIEHGVISILSSKHKDNSKDRLDFFIQNGIFSIAIEPCFDETLFLSPDDYATFMIELFEAWLNLGEPRVRIRFFEGVIQGLMGYVPKICTMSGMCRSFICFEKNGDVLPCDQPFNKLYKYGNILESDLSTILQSEKHQSFIQSDLKMQEKCSSCKWFLLCHGGCPFLRTVKNQEINSKDYFCEGYQKIFAHITNRIDQILENF